MELKSILSGLEGLKVKGDLTIDITNIDSDSRNIKPNGLFVAISGFDVDDIIVYDGQKANFRVIEENRIYKVDVTRTTTLAQTIVIPANVCNDIENGIPNTYSVP